MNNRALAYLSFAMALTGLLKADTSVTLPPPVIVMTGVSNPLLPGNTGVPSAAGVKRALAATSLPVNMKVLVLAGDTSEFSYQSITAYLTQIGVPFDGIAVDTLTPDSNGNRLSGLALSTPAGDRGLYQGIIETNTTFGVCNPTCVGLLSAADFATIAGYASQFKVRVVGYYTYPEAKWGLSVVGSGASYTAASPLSVNLTTAGAAIFPYINSKNAVPVSGSGTGGIFAYRSTTVAAAGETTTPILTSGASTLGVTHTAVDGSETMALTFDNYPTLLHSLAFSYGVINWVTKGVFLGSRQVYLNIQDDDILFGDRLYAPTLPKCPSDPSCPDIRSTSADLKAFANWQDTKHRDAQFPYVQNTYVYVGFGSTPGFAPVPDTLPAAMTSMATNFGWLSHTWTHGNIDCYTLTATGGCIPQTLSQALFELETNLVYGASLGITTDTTGMVTPFNGGLSNLAFLQASAEEGITSVITPTDPPSPGTGSLSPLVPSILLMPRRVTNLFDDVDSPSTGVSGSLPDEYNSLYGPSGKTPVFTTNQTYSQIIDNESTMLLQMRFLTYESYPLGFHTSNSIAYDGTHSLMTDLFDATIKKYEQLYTLPVNTLSMRDIAPLLLNRMSYNASGVTGVYTPGVSVVLTTVNAATIPVTGACSQGTCPAYGGQLQDAVTMAAGSTVTLSLNATAGGAGLSKLTLNPASVGSLTPSQGVVTLNSVATSNVVVTLSSNNPSVVVPASVTITPGNSGAAFTATTKVVTSSTTATITASYTGGGATSPITQTFNLTVTPAVALSGLSLNPASVPSGSSSTATVSLTAAAPAGGLIIPLLSNNASATTPATVTVNGGSSSAIFSVATGAVTGSVTGNILAIYNGVTQIAPLTVTPVALSGVTLNPVSVTGGSSASGSVALTGPAPAGGIVVALSDNTGVTTVPATVTVSAGSTTAVFTVTTTTVATSTIATVTASYSGVKASATLTVSPASAFTLAPSAPSVSVTQGSKATDTITVTRLSGFTGSVTLAASGLPTGITASFGTNPTTGSSVMTLTAGASAVTGNATVTVGGTSGALTASTSVALSVIASCTPTAITPYLQVNGAAWQQVSTVTAASGSSVNLGPQPLGGTWSWTGPNGFTSTAREIDGIPLVSGANTFIATYTNASGCSSNQAFVVTVPAASFTLSPSASSVSVNQNSSVTNTITVAGLNGFNGSVSLAASGLPSGVTASFGTNPTTGSSVLKLTAGSSATPGTTTTTITGTSGALTASTTVPLTVVKSGFSCHVADSTLLSFFGGFIGDLTIYNTGNTDISSWTLTWTFAGNQNILALWNGNVAQNGANVTVTNAFWNGSIPAGGNIGGVDFTAFVSGSNALPTSFAVNGTTCK